MCAWCDCVPDQCEYVPGVFKIGNHEVVLKSVGEGEDVSMVTGVLDFVFQRKLTAKQKSW